MQHTTLTELTQYLLTIRLDVINAFGTARPLAPPTDGVASTSPADGCGATLVLHDREGARLAWSNRNGVSDILINVASKIHPECAAHEISRLVMEKWRFDPRLIFAFRALALNMRVMWINPHEAKRHHVIARCAELILQSMLVEHTTKHVGRQSKYRRGLEQRMVGFADTGFGGTNSSSLPDIGRYSLLHKIYTQKSKRVVGTAINDLITYRYQQATDRTQLCRVVEPDVNFARRVATMDLLLNGATELDVSDLLTILVRVVDRLGEGVHDLPKDATVAQKIRASNGSSSDAELIHLANALYEMGRSWLRTKLVEVNQPYCTCHVKCVGQTGLYPELEKAFYDVSAPLHLSTVICGGCRLAHTIENTTACKPRRSVSSHNPKLTTCTLDNISAFKHVPLYAFRVVDRLTVMYSHRFYVTNSMNIVDEVYGRKQSAPGSRIYGVCYSGRRTCFKRFIDLLPSSRYMDSSTPPFRETHRWFRCTSCRDLPVYDPSINAYIPWNAIQHEDTCLQVVEKQCKRWYREFGDWYRAVDECAAIMCRGCRAAALCRHAMNGLLKIYLKERGESRVILRRLFFLGALQRWIYQHGLK